MPTALPWDNCRSVVCLRPDNLGDVLMTTPALRAVKETLPGCRLTLLTSPAGAAIAAYIPVVDDVMTCDVPWVSNDQNHGPEAVSNLIQELKQRQFDAAIVFTVQSQNPLPAAMVCYLAGIPRVLGYCRENPYRLLTDWVPDSEVLYATRHEVQRQLDLVATIGCRTSNQRLSLRISPGAGAQAARVLREAGVNTDQSWLLLHAGVSEVKRQYPAEEYIKAGRCLQEQGYQLVLTGNAAERAYVQKIRAGLSEKAYNLAGLLSLEAFIGLIAQAPVLVSNNTGPVHIAAAVGTPVVVLYAMTNPQHTPWRVANRVLYFEVSQSLRSRNSLLQHFPGPAEPKASPAAIGRAVQELSRQGKESVNYTQ